MKKYLSLVLLLACTLTGTAVQAQQCYNAPVQTQPCYPIQSQPCYAEPCCYDDSGVYVSAFGGANWLNQHKKHDFKTTYDVGYAAGAALGYRFNRNFRAEAEIAYRNNHLDSVKHHYYGKVHPKGHTSSLSYMANGYYDFDLDGFTPYVGVGVGYAHLKAHVSHEGVQAKGSESGIAGQAMVGVSKRICHNTDLGVEYRYFAARSNFHEQSVNLSLRYGF